MIYLLVSKGLVYGAFSTYEAAREAALKAHPLQNFYIEVWEINGSIQGVILVKPDP